MKRILLSTSIVLGATVCWPIIARAQLVLPYSGVVNSNVPTEGFVITQSGTGRAIRGVNTNTAGAGLAGVATAATGVTYGAYGSATSASGTGFYGWSNGTGVWGNSPSGIGVKAESATGTALRVIGDAVFDPDSLISCGGAFTIGGANLALHLGDSTADDVYIDGGDLRMRASEGDSHIYFYESGSPTFEFLGWDDAANQFVFSDDLALVGGNLSVSGNGTISGNLTVVGSNLLFNDTSDLSARIQNSYDIRIEHDMDNDNAASWFRVFTDGTAFEQLRINDGDEASILGDGTFTSNGIDYAEAFKISEADLEPGDVASLHVGYWEYCLRSTQANDAHVLGVVSEKPGFLTGLSFNAQEAAAPAIAKQRAEAQARGDVKAEKELAMQLASAAQELHRAVAILGRVPCKVVGAVKAGDFLTTSDTPGHAMVMTQAGPSLGVALEDSAGPGPGKVMVMVQPGWRVPAGGNAAAANADLQAQVAAQQQEIEQLKAAVATLAARP